MGSDYESLSGALHRAAEQLERIVGEVDEIHRQYVRLCEIDRSWRRIDDAVADEVRHKRIDVGLYAASLLVEQLRSEAAEASRRYPAIDARGQELPPRPPTDEPADIRDWWAGLSERAREQLLDQRTQWVGSTDGLPVRVRHRANLRLLEAEISRRTKEWSSITTDHDAPIDEIAQQERHDLQGLLRIRDFLGYTGGAGNQGSAHLVGLENVKTPPEQRFLYLLDARDYPLKTAILLGDLDVAEHVVLHVPGATTTVELRLFREMSWMSNLRTEAGRLLGDIAGADRTPGADKVAVLDWIGYHAPYDITARRSLTSNGLSVIIPGEAINDRYAREAAPHLVQAAKGLRALIGPKVRLVSSGHSYGGSVTGLALMATDVYDAAMVAGCPGIFAKTLHQLKVPAKAFFIAIAPTDLVGLLGVFGVECMRIPGVQLLSPYARRVFYPDGSWSVLLPTVGHEMYYNVNSATLHHLAAVVVGQLSKAKTTTWLGMVRSGSDPSQSRDSTSAGRPTAAVTRHDRLTRSDSAD